MLCVKREGSPAEAAAIDLEDRGSIAPEVSLMGSGGTRKAGYTIHSDLLFMIPIRVTGFEVSLSVVVGGSPLPLLLLFNHRL